MLSLCRSLSRVLSRIFLWFAGLGLVVMTGIIGWQVFARYVLQSSPAWAEQASLFLMVWYINLAAAAGVREGFHIRMTVVQNAVPPRAARWMRLATHGVVAAIGAAMLFWGAELCIRTWDHLIPTLGLPRGSSYVSIPIAGALIVFFTLEHIVAEFSGREVEQLWS